MIWLAVGILVVILAIPVILLSRLGTPDPAEAPGEFVTLTQGITHYRWIGPARGPVIVAIHGLTTPSPVWEAVATGLGQIGYRVLIYDLYGRGYSGNAKGRQDRAFFLHQLDELLRDQGLTDDLTLMGYSMGGAIAAAYAADHPDRMKRLILIAPAGIEVNETRFDRLTRQIPVIGDWLHIVVQPGRMRTALAAERNRTTEVAGISDIQLAQLRRHGFLSAVLSSRRGILENRQEQDHRKIGRDGVPVIAIWGDEDSIIPLRALGTLSIWNRQVAQEVVKGAGHGLTHTHATAVAELLRSVLRE